MKRLRSNNGLPVNRMQRSDPRWADWMRNLRARGRYDLLDAAEAAGEITIIGSTIPTPASPLPVIGPAFKTRHGVLDAVA